MRFSVLLSLFFISINGLLANADTTFLVDYDTLRLIESHNTPNSFFKNRYHHYQLEEYLDSYQELVLYQNETVGDFARPDFLTYSVSGNSYKWNRYYINGFRVNDVFYAGHSLYKPDLFNFNLKLDVWNTSLELTQIDTLERQVIAQWNRGKGFGGASPYTDDMIHWFHDTAEEKLFAPANNRRMTKSGYNIFANFYTTYNGRKLFHSAQINTGTRMWLGFNYYGANRYYPENFLSMNFMGEMPLLFSKLFDRNYYLVSHLNRENLFAEYYFDKNETAYLGQTNVSFYGDKKVSENTNYTSGITVGTKTIEHENINFSRNFVDVDGEGVEPWYPDGNILQLSHAFKLKKKLTSKLKLEMDNYNSLVRFNPTINSFYNPLYFQSRPNNYTSLYIYNWETNAFTSGLLENTLGVNWKHSDSNKLTMIAVANATFDGFVLKDKTRMSPNWEAEFRTLYNPFKFLELTLSVGRKRIPYHFEQIKFLSNDYLSGIINYWDDKNNDETYQEGEMGNVFTSTGGKYHNLPNDVDQPIYYYVEFPFKIKVGQRHNFVFYNQYRKYVNNWRVSYVDDEENVGYYKNDIFFQNAGIIEYEVEEFRKDKLTSVNGNDHFLFDTPFFSGSTFKYQYNSKKVFFVITWTYHQLIGLGSYGNGFLHNDLDVLSESQANPNSDINGVALLDSDRSYVGRLLLSYKISKNVSTSFTFKFKDGQTVSSYGTKIITDGDENQIAVWMLQMKGNNEFNDDHGNREDAFFNSVLRIEYNGNKFYGNIGMYNLYDFKTDLSQYAYSPTDKYSRFSLEFVIPRGLIVSLGYKF